MLSLMGEGVDRRAFLRGAAAGGAAVAFGGLPDLARSRPGPAGKRPGPARGGRFHQGVASGEPSLRSMRVWTRVEDIERAGTVELEVARDAGFRQVVERRRVLAKKNRDFTVNEQVGGLEPGEEYYYRFDTGRRSSPVGRFRTLRPRDSNQPVRIAVFSCQDWAGGYYNAHAGLAAEDDIDLVICLGDYIYERNYYEDAGPRTDTLGANGDGEVQTLSEYRQKYALYHSDPNLRAMRAAHPLIGIWDDHEVEDNWAGRLPGDATIDPRLEFGRRRRNGFRAYFEHMPFEPFGRRGSRGPRRVYRSLKLGRHAEVILLDERKYRDDQPCDDAAPPGPECTDAELNEPGRAMLGEEQKAWLKKRLRRSDATWKLVANPLMMMSLDVPQGKPFIIDAWDGYGAERTEVMDYIAAKGIKDVAFLTGDIHTFFAGAVSRTGRQSALGMPASLATEFVCGSISSHGVPELFGLQDVPPELQAIIGSEVALKQNNPHYEYAEISHRGYGVIEAGPDELNVAFRAPASALVEPSPVSDLQRFVVQSGTPAVNLV